LVVYRPGAEIHDPETGELLGRNESKIGMIKLSSHQNERLSNAVPVFGQQVQAGDIVSTTP